MSGKICQTMWSLKKHPLGTMITGQSDHSETLSDHLEISSFLLTILTADPGQDDSQPVLFKF